MTFSQILMTTRNESLDRLCSDTCIGGERTSAQTLRTKLRYGELIDKRKVNARRVVNRHMCFGLEEEIA